ncbi:post-transcriptional regulator [Halobacillus salinarum]|uniref:Post-transcriptional regulator n=1 Tax=Halobacillus salinarum TaxID=2932257 RepID=A0ABY4EQC5_9BACI|nr:post-transcriptional regulator [Halobacillus salinarum]UOQ46276.1 post-transcriptional regulator [Halobacillus salinarum]
MEQRRPISQWKTFVVPVLQSKVEEFKILGYSRATKEDVWSCLRKKVWKGEPSMRLYEVVQDIFHLSSQLYVSYLTVEAYKDEDLLASIKAVSGEMED